MKVNKVYTKYEISNNDFAMDVKVGKDRVDLIRSKGSMSYLTNRHDFRFHKSKPALVENFAKVMLKAVQLSKEE